MVYLVQLSLLGLVAGAAVGLLKNLPKRIVLAINAFAGGIMLLLLITTISDVLGRLAELFGVGTAGPGYSVAPWIFAAATLFGIFGVPLLLIFLLKERRRSVIIAVALGLFNLAFAMKFMVSAFFGFSAAGFTAVALLTALFALEGILIGSLFLKGNPAPVQLAVLVATALLAALAGFNIPSGAAPDYVVPFAESIAAGLLLFCLPFSVAAVANPDDVKWQFIGMIGGLITSAFVLSTITNVVI